MGWIGKAVPGFAFWYRESRRLMVATMLPQAGSFGTGRRLESKRFRFLRTHAALCRPQSACA